MTGLKYRENMQAATRYTEPKHRTHAYVKTYSQGAQQRFVF